VYLARRLVFDLQPASRPPASPFRSVCGEAWFFTPVAVGRWQKADRSDTYLLHTCTLYAAPMRGGATNCKYYLDIIISIMFNASAAESYMQVRSTEQGKLKVTHQLLDAVISTKKRQGILGGAGWSGEVSLKGSLVESMSTTSTP
jgi:hypothetical protein